jgi:hypothetical protein
LLFGVGAQWSFCFEAGNDLNAEALGNIMLTLSKLAVRNEYCQEIYDKGGLKFAIKCLTENDDLVCSVCGAFLAFHPKSKFVHFPSRFLLKAR